MAIEPKIYRALSTSAALTAVVSTRIYPVTGVQDGSCPLLVYQRVSGQRFTCLPGKSRLENVRVQFDTYSTDYIEVRQSVAALIDCLHTTTLFRAVPLYSPIDDYDDDLRVYRRTLDVSIWHYDAEHGRTLALETLADIFLETGDAIDLEGW